MITELCLRHCLLRLFIKMLMCCRNTVIGKAVWLCVPVFVRAFAIVIVVCAHRCLNAAIVWYLAAQARCINGRGASQ